MNAKEAPSIPGLPGFSFADLANLGLNPLDFLDPISFDPSELLTIRESGAKAPEKETRFRLTFPLYSSFLQFLKDQRGVKQYIEGCSSFIVQVSEFNEETMECRIANFLLDPDWKRQMIFVSVSGGDVFIPKEWKRWKWENEKKQKSKGK